MNAAEHDQRFGPLALYVYAWSDAAGATCRRCRLPSPQCLSVIRHRQCRRSARDCEMLHDMDACCGAFLTAADDPRAAVVTFVCHACLARWWGDLEMIWPDGTRQTPRQRLRAEDLKRSA